MKSKYQDRARGMMVGLAVGDALPLLHFLLLLLYPELAGSYYEGFFRYIHICKY